MTIAPVFAVTRNPAPLAPAEREAVLADPGFGTTFTDHMISISYTRDEGWHDAQALPYGPISLEPSARVFHYAEEIFEGLKAYRQPDGSVAVFRPESNARRFQRSARRLGIPELPEDLFLGAIRQLIALDNEWVPPAGSEHSLYLRPFAFADEFALGLHLARSYRFLVIACPSGPYFKGGVKPTKIWVSSEYTRAAPGGTGDAKCGGNYAAAMVGQIQAVAHECDQVIFLDAVERKYLEEGAGMNLFLVFGSGAQAKLVTPATSGTILEGVTRDSILQLAVDAGYAVEERRVSFDELRDKAQSGEITEMFACGTAAVVTPIGEIRSAEGEFVVGDGGAGNVTMALRDTLTGIQRGQFADAHNWITTLWGPGA
ncbi:branched-chain amino acid aminotransferase [Segniliparus rugosus]|uniref:Branched-chain-amino-acid aminotransferase n=1 Tax=Segniliparus rugosus (strain ATCC BAA-974 / DSM 45345 / CCUG 50838 / CIP 108380 / JCM 13579 / CDC 945) TaxID=679197 RepID=E5XML5_SEGRC|nr:branched-chain amino acid aminotransferase [Segniliparus rugosus]EFV14411.1 branched-chain amino acid aminotransferase [Segniliparus rugosus ATCC BAA-974]